MRVLLQVFEDTSFAGGTPTCLCLANGTWRRDVEEVLKLMDPAQLPQCLWMETVYDDVSPLDLPALNAEIALFMDQGNTSACIIKATHDGPDTLHFRGALRQWKPPAPASTMTSRDRSTFDSKSPDRGEAAGRTGFALAPGAPSEHGSGFGSGRRRRPRHRGVLGTGGCSAAFLGLGCPARRFRARGDALPADARRVSATSVAAHCTHPDSACVAELPLFRYLSLAAARHCRLNPVSLRYFQPGSRMQGVEEGVAAAVRELAATPQVTDIMSRKHAGLEAGSDQHQALLLARFKE